MVPSKPGEVIRVLHDGISSGHGHTSRAESIAERLSHSGFEVVLYDLDEPTPQEKLIGEEANLIGTVIDSYRPRRYFDEIGLELSSRVLQIIDFDEQEAWGDWILDPFSTKKEAGVTWFQGLDYAIVPDLLGFQPKAELNDHLIISIGSSSPQILEPALVHMLCDLWVEVTLVSKEPLSFRAPENMMLLAPKPRLEFWKIVSEHSFMISNAGVTGLERIYLGIPGVCVPTESNQRFAARALQRAGANVFSLEGGTFPPLSSLMERSETWKRIPEKVSIGQGLNDVLKRFVYAKPA